MEQSHVLANNLEGIDFHAERKLHPQYVDLEADASVWLLDKYKLEDTLKFRQNTKISMFVSRIFANVEWSHRLILANRLNVVWLILQEYLDSYGDCDVESELSHFFKDDDCTVTHPLTLANKEVMLSIKQLSPYSRYVLFKQNVREFFYFHKLTGMRCNDQMDMTYVELMRWLNYGGFAIFRLIEFVNNAYLRPPVRESMLVRYLDHFAQKATSYYGDYTAFQDHLQGEEPYSIIVHLKCKHGGSIDETVYALKSIIEEDLRVFQKVSDHCVQLHEGDNGLQVYIEGLKAVIQGSKDYCEDVFYIVEE